MYSFDGPMEGLRRWMVTGGTGSFGRAFVDRLLKQDWVERVVVFSRDELKQSQMAEDHGHDPSNPKDRLRFFLGDIRDRSRLELAMRGVDVVIHAAALKQVPALEYSPTEAVRTNVDGAVNVVHAALSTPSVKRVVGLSTDKSSQPTTLYGATKLTMERLLVAANAYTGGGLPVFTCTRYGNVTGSRGSVLNVWNRALSAGRPLPLTHEDMTRYWMTIEDAVDLVLRAVEVPGAHGFPGVVRIPRLRAYRVGDLAKAFYLANDVQPEADAYEVVGVRGVEKMDETLIGDNEAVLAADCTDGSSDSALMPPEAVGRFPRTLGDESCFSSGTADRMTTHELVEALRGLGWGS